MHLKITRMPYGSLLTFFSYGLNCPSVPNKNTSKFPKRLECQKISSDIADPRLKNKRLAMVQHLLDVLLLC